MVGDCRSTRVWSGCSPSCRNLRGNRTSALVTRNIRTRCVYTAPRGCEILRTKRSSEPHLFVVGHPHRALQAECCARRLLVPKILTLFIPEILSHPAIAGRGRTLSVPPVGRPVGRR